jgi:hypothetical protein
MRYGVALALTLAIECPIYVSALARFADCRPTSGALRGVGVNLISHPLAIGVSLPVLAVLIGFWWALIVVEVGVFLLEGALLRLATPNVAFDRLGLIALGANVASLSVGLAVLS